MSESNPSAKEDLDYLAELRKVYVGKRVRLFGSGNAFRVTGVTYDPKILNRYVLEVETSPGSSRGVASAFASLLF
jgi:hypothetical protein